MYIIDEKDNNKVWESGYAIYCQCGVYPSFDALEYDKISIEKNLNSKSSNNNLNDLMSSVNDELVNLNQ